MLKIGEIRLISNKNYGTMAAIVTQFKNMYANDLYGKRYDELNAEQKKQVRLKINEEFPNDPHKTQRSKRGPIKLDRIAGELIDKLKKSPRFYSIPKTAAGDDFFIFRRAGDMLYGLLYGKHSQVGVARSCSYRMLAYQAIQDNKILPINPEGQIVEFPGCALLQRIIDNPKNDLRGSLVRIVYIGRLKKSRGIGRSMKIFEVYKDKGTITPNFQRQQPKPKRSKKHG